MYATMSLGTSLDTIAKGQDYRDLSALADDHEVRKFGAVTALLSEHPFGFGRLREWWE